MGNEYRTGKYEQGVVKRGGWKRRIAAYCGVNV